MKLIPTLVFWNGVQLYLCLLIFSKVPDVIARWHLNISSNSRDMVLFISVHASDVCVTFFGRNNYLLYEADCSCRESLITQCLLSLVYNCTSSIWIVHFLIILTTVLLTMLVGSTQEIWIRSWTSWICVVCQILEMFSFALVGKVVLKIVCKVVFWFVNGTYNCRQIVRVSLFLLRQFSGLFQVRSLNEFQWLALEAIGSWH